MEGVLEQHASNIHWRHSNEAWLVQRLIEEVAELTGLVLGGESQTINYEDMVLSECCDVANFAMMIADNFGGMRKERPNHP